MIIISSNGLSLFIALRAKVLVQRMMERYDYTSRTACLRNRIAIPYHQHSKYEGLPSGCFLGLCLFYHASSTAPTVVSVVPVVFVVLKTSSSKAHRAIRVI